MIRKYLEMIWSALVYFIETHGKEVKSWVISSVMVAVNSALPEAARMAEINHINAILLLLIRGLTIISVAMAIVLTFLSIKKHIKENGVSKGQ